MRNLFDEEPQPPTQAEMIAAARRLLQLGDALGLFEVVDLAELLLAGLAPGSDPRK